MIAIRAERLQTQTKTTHRQPTFTFGKGQEMSSGMLLKMNFQIFIEVRIYSQPQRMRPTGALTLKSRAPFYEILRHWHGRTVNLKLCTNSVDTRSDFGQL